MDDFKRVERSEAYRDFHPKEASLVAMALWAVGDGKKFDRLIQVPPYFITKLGAVVPDSPCQESRQPAVNTRGRCGFRGSGREAREGEIKEGRI